MARRKTGRKKRKYRTRKRHGGGRCSPKRTCEECIKTDGKGGKCVWKSHGVDFTRRMATEYEMWRPCRAPKTLKGRNRTVGRGWSRTCPKTRRLTRHEKRLRGMHTLRIHGREFDPSALGIRSLTKSKPVSRAGASKIQSVPLSSLTGFAPEPRASAPPMEASATPVSQSTLLRTPSGTHVRATPSSVPIYHPPRLRPDLKSLVDDRAVTKKQALDMMSPQIAPTNQQLVDALPLAPTGPIAVRGKSSGTRQRRRVLATGGRRGRRRGTKKQRRRRRN